MRNFAVYALNSYFVGENPNPNYRMRSYLENLIIRHLHWLRDCLIKIQLEEILTHPLKDVVKAVLEGFNFRKMVCAAMINQHVICIKVEIDIMVR